MAPAQRPESSPVPEVESVVENGVCADDRKRHKKDKKHKKEKKHKRKKEKRRSQSAERPLEVVEQEATQTTALDVDVAQADPLAEVRETTAHSTPESGEIGDPQDSLTSKENTVQSSSDRVPALKHKIARSDLSPRKRHKSGEGDPARSHKVDSSPKNGLAGALPPPPSRNEGHRVEVTGHRTEIRAGADRRDDRRPRSRPRDDSRSRAWSPARRSDSARHDIRPRSRARSRDTVRSEGRHRDDRDRRREYGRPEDRRPREESRGRRRSASRDGGDRSRKPEERKNRRSGSNEKEDKEFAAKVIAKLEEKEEDEDALIEQRRKRRQELLAKLQQEQELANAVAQPTASELTKQPSLSQQASDPPPERVTTAVVTVNGSAEPLQGNNPIMRASSPNEAIDERAASEAQRGIQVVESDTEDEEVPEATEEQLFQQRKERLPEEKEHPAALTPQESSDERHKIQNQEKKRKQELDMFAAVAVEDMFGDEPVCAPAAADAPKRGLLDNYDDSEGYYNFQVGEIMDGRYEVFATHGKGVFSTVLRARDGKNSADEKGKSNPAVRTTFPEVAIKVIRANDIMSKAGQAEVVILRKLAGADPTSKYHIIRLLRTFEYRHHLCLVFEPLESNLRQLTKKYGQGIGLRLDAVRSMAAQMLMALHLMKQCGVLHADIKPDNILINKGHNIVKMCDFGSAMFTGNNEITPYLVSRFYRAPEIILGLHYDHPMDVWSIGCVVFELFTGRILFPGRTNNEMLKLMMDAKGAFPKKMLKKGEFTLQHFEDDPNMSFCQMEMDPLTKRPVRQSKGRNLVLAQAKRLVPNPTIKKDFRGLLAGQEGDSKQVASLVDLLEKMMHLDPEKRLTAKEALRHPFIKDGRLTARA